MKFIKAIKELLTQKKEDNWIVEFRKLYPKAKYQIIIGNKDFPATEKDIAQFRRAYKRLKFTKPSEVVIASHLIEFKELINLKKESDLK